MTEVLVFSAQFVLVFLLGIQSQFVRDGNYVGAAITSFCLGVAGFYTTMQIAIIKEMFTTMYWFYISAGPLAIVSSIYTHRKFSRWLGG